MTPEKKRRKFLTRIRHKVAPPIPDDFTDEELWGVPGDPLRPGRAFMCRDDIEVRMRIKPPDAKPDGLMAEISLEFDLPEWME